jgi:vancomycin permeability regulator SanA
VVAPTLIVRLDTRDDRSTDPASLPHKVTQSYHLPRAVYTCRGVGIDAVGLGAADWGTYPTGQMAHYQVREMLASVKAMWDVDLGHPGPRYLGPHVQLNLQPAAGA